MIVLWLSQHNSIAFVHTEFDVKNTEVFGLKTDLLSTICSHNSTILYFLLDQTWKFQSLDTQPYILAIYSHIYVHSYVYVCLHTCNYIILFHTIHLVIFPPMHRLIPRSHIYVGIWMCSSKASTFSCPNYYMPYTCAIHI